jgi:hypothetical protein
MGMSEVITALGPFIKADEENAPQRKSMNERASQQNVQQLCW